MFVILRGPRAGKTENILPTCKFSLSELKPCAQCSFQICAVYWAQMIGNTCCQFHALRTVLGRRGGDAGKSGKDSISPKQSAPVICICVRIKGHTGLLQKSCFWWDLRGHTNIAPPMKISLKPSACSIPLQLKSLCSALCEQQFHSFWPFLHGWGEWIRQRNHYRFKSHSLTKSRLLVLPLSPQRTREWFPLSVNSCPEGGRGPGAGGMVGEGLEVREPDRGGSGRALHTDLPSIALPLPLSPWSTEYWAYAMWGRGKDPDTIMPENCHQKWPFCYKFELARSGGRGSVPFVWFFSSYPLPPHPQREICVWGVRDVPWAGYICLKDVTLRPQGEGGGTSWEEYVPGALGPSQVDGCQLEEPRRPEDTWDGSRGRRPDTGQCPGPFPKGIQLLSVMFSAVGFRE